MAGKKASSEVRSLKLKELGLNKMNEYRNHFGPKLTCLITFLRSRTRRVVANFSVSFSIISVITGVTTLYGTGLQFGGPVTMVYGWPIAGAFTVAVGLAMAEICSAYPTSGGLYFWSARLCTHRRWGPFAAWLTGW